MPHENYLGLQWAAPTCNEIRVKTVLMHGSGDVFTEVALNFPDTPAGQQDARLAIEAIPHVSAALARNRQTNTEAVCEVVAARLPSEFQATPAGLFRMLDKLVVCDATGGDHFAALVAMAVERHTPQGIFRATFPAGDGTTRHYKAFGNAHPRNLKPWA